MISKEGKCYDGFVKDEKGNYLFVISKPNYQYDSNQSGTQFNSDLYYAYVVLNLQPDGIGCWVWRQRQQHLFFDRNIESNQSAVTKEYGSAVSYMPESSAVEVRDPVTSEITEIFRVFVGENRKGYIVDKEGVRLPNNRTIVTEKGTTIFATSDDSLDPSTLYRNWFGTSYVGPNNPKNYLRDKYNYDFLPESPIEWSGYKHDLKYNIYGAEGIPGALFDTRVLEADQELSNDAMMSIIVGLIAPSKTANNKQIIKETIGATFAAIGFYYISKFKIEKRKYQNSINQYYEKQNCPPVNISNLRWH